MKTKSIQVRMDLPPKKRVQAVLAEVAANDGAFMVNGEPAFHTGNAVVFGDAWDVTTVVLLRYSNRSITQLAYELLGQAEPIGGHHEIWCFRQNDFFSVGVIGASVFHDYKQNQMFFFSKEKDHAKACREASDWFFWTFFPKQAAKHRTDSKFAVTA